MRRLFGGAVALTLVLGFGRGALAQEDDSDGSKTHTFELGAMVGGHFFSTKPELGVPDQPGLVPSPKSMVLVGIRAAYVLPSPRLGIEGELVAIPTTDSFDDESAFVLGWRAQLRYDIGTFSKVTPFVAAGIGGLSVFADGGGTDRIADDTDTTFHWGPGLMYDLSDDLALRANAWHILLPSTGDKELTSDLEIHLGIALKLGGKAEPPPPPPPPPEPQDSDGDGINDEQDRCPADPEDRDGFEDDDGCPDPDNDGDGIPDGEDRCPDEAETRNGVDDEDGCPEEDTDGDGLLGSNDKCPEQAEDRDGFQDEDGCPDPDNDGDGVLDADDKCPTELETRNGFEDEDGCPDEVPKQVQRFTGVIKGINFKRNSAEIRSSSFRVLNRAVKVLKDYPNVRIEISGHTSAEGDRQHNVDLSWARANAVKDYMVAQGIEESRIVTIGHGPDQPIADNKSRRGRRKNRRIEFKIIVDEGQAPPVETAPPDESQLPEEE